MKKNVLIHNFIENDELNIERVISEYTPYVYTILRNQAVNLQTEDIEEIISDIFLAVWKNQHKLDVDKSMGAYVSGIAKNLLKKKFRGLVQINNIEDYEDILMSSSNLDIDYEANERNRLILEKLNELKQEDKDIFLSYYYYSKKIKQISSELNISQSKIKSKLHTIRQKLKKYFEIKEA